MILCAGVFDGLHAGHVNYLAAARRTLPGELVVAVAPDAYVIQEKGRLPGWPQIQRARTVDALHDVDRTICYPEKHVDAVIRAYRPTYFVKGADWRGRLPAEVTDACASVGCEVVYVETNLRHTSEARG